MNQKEWDRMIGQELYDPFNVHDDSFQRVHAAQRKFNASDDLNDRQAFEELKRCFAQAPDDMVLLAPVYFDHGDRIRFGRHFFANTGLTILDENYVTFGDNVFLAPHVSIYTAGHPIDAEVRNTNLEYAKPVTIGSDVWIGGNVVINPGVTFLIMKKENGWYLQLITERLQKLSCLIMSCKFEISHLISVA